MPTPPESLFERIRANLAVKGASADACVHMMQIQKICDAHEQRLREVEAERDKYKEALELICDDGTFPTYHTQGMGCGLEDRCINDRYEAMAHGWNSLADRVHDEVIAIAVEALESTTPQPEKKL
jgi:hypothetical protein